MTKKYDRKPRFQRLYAGLLGKALAAVFAVAALQLTVCATEPVEPDFPEDVPEDAITLTPSFSLTEIKDNVGKVYYVPAGTRVTAANVAQTIQPSIYCAGQVQAKGLSGSPIFFNDLKLLAGGELYYNQICPKSGYMTILSEDETKPALLTYYRNEVWTRVFNFGFKVFGSKESHLRYQMGNEVGKALLSLQGGSDWSGFEGTLHIADGVGIENESGVPIAMPGSVEFGNGGILRMNARNAPYSFGNLSFVEGGAITNTGSGSTLTVTGTFDTGKNCSWFSRNAGTFGTLKLGDGFTLIDDQESPTTVLTIMKKLEVGKNISIEYPNVSPFNGAEKSKVLLMKLAPEAVQAGVPDLSGIAVSFTALYSGVSMQLTTEEDQDVSGGLLVYATHDPVVYYNGPDEFYNDESGNNIMNGLWLDPNQAPALWGDGLYPDGAKTYVVTKGVFFSADNGRVTTFPGKTLLCRADLYVEKSCVVTNLMFDDKGRLYVRVSGAHIEGNLTAIDDTAIRSFHNSKVYIDSVLHGAGALKFNSYYPEINEGGGTFYLTADNTDWTGSFEMLWTPNKDYDFPPSIDHHTRIVVGDAKSLGGNPAAFTHNAMVLDNYAEIRFTNTTVQTASKRGLYAVNGILRVDEGATAALTAPVTLAGTLRKTGAGTLALGGGIRYAANNDLTDTAAPEADKNIVLVQEGAIKGSSLAQAAVTFSDGTGIAADTASGAMDLTGATVTAEGTIYLKADGNTLPEPTQAVTYPIVKVSAAQATELGDKFKAARSPWRGWPVTLVSETDADGNVTYSVKYEKKGFVMSIR